MPLDQPQSLWIIPNPIGFAPVPSWRGTNPSLCPSWLFGTCPCGTQVLPTEVAPGGAPAAVPSMAAQVSLAVPPWPVPAAGSARSRRPSALSSPLAAPHGPGAGGAAGTAGTALARWHRPHRPLLPNPRGAGCPALLEGGHRGFFGPPPNLSAELRGHMAGMAVLGAGREGGKEGEGGSGVRYFSIPGSAGPANKGAIELQPLCSVKQKPPCISSGAFDLPPPGGMEITHVLLLGHRCQRPTGCGDRAPRSPGMSQRHPLPFLCIPKPFPNFGGSSRCSAKRRGGRSRALRLAFLSCN